MKKIIVIITLSLCLFGCKNDDKQTNSSQTPPSISALGIEGGGKYTTGGKGGVIIPVTSLEDDLQKSGTLRYALSRPGAKTIIFNVSGQIKLKSDLVIKKGNLTIAGQTAPGEGICISGYPVIVDADNVILQFLHFRLGDDNVTEADALTCVGQNNIVIDHCSMSWSVDECASCYGNTNFTMQWCMISESLRESIHDKGTHGYGGIWGGTNATFHHNLLAHHDSRNPRFDHDYVAEGSRGPVDFVNNVIYNWKGNSTYGGESQDVADYRKFNMENNYYKYGPDTKEGAIRYRILNPTVKCPTDPTTKCGSNNPGHFYISGNYVDGYPDATADNWGKGVQGVSSDIIAKIKHTSRFAMPEIKNKQSAEDAYNSVLEKCGASKQRDIVDTRIINDVKNRTGNLINSPSDVGGYPEYATIENNKDSDFDGMPDEWEDANGLNKNNYKDGKEYTFSTDYSNFEWYLYDIVKHLY